MGGSGWRVINDLWSNRASLQQRRGFNRRRFSLNSLKLRGLSLHSRLVLRSTLLLVGIGALGLLFTEQFASGGVIEDLQWW